MNVIEHLWAILKKRYHENPCSNRYDMLAKLKQIWNEITADVTKTLVNWVYRRFEAVLRSKGGTTMY